MKLSDTMLQALKAIVLEYDRSVTAERRRWGEEHAQNLAKKGIDPALLVDGHRTLHALEKRGFITFTTRAANFGETPRRGAYGRRIGGVKQQPYTQFIVKPTAAGRAIALS